MNWQFSLPRLLRAPSHTLRQIEYVFEKEEVSWLTHVHEFNRVYFSLYYLIIVSIESTFRRFNCSLKKKKKKEIIRGFPYCTPRTQPLFSAWRNSAWILLRLWKLQSYTPPPPPHPRVHAPLDGRVPTDCVA